MQYRYTVPLFTKYTVMVEKQQKQIWNGNNKNLTSLTNLGLQAIVTFLKLC